ncbi:hypothetical protein L1049_007324 [Liquidambar formosana]|uniref:Uncharacterized protein n=1 Tax=Liquidambar formosana TaxID=63359 RepID=A0AAP0WSA8_LIQFO
MEIGSYAFSVYASFWMPRNRRKRNENSEYYRTAISKILFQFPTIFSHQQPDGPFGTLNIYDFDFVDVWRLLQVDPVELLAWILIFRKWHNSILSNCVFHDSEKSQLVSNRAGFCDFLRFKGPIVDPELASEMPRLLSVLCDLSVLLIDLR